MLDKTLHIVYASDDKFSEILGVSLVSLYENNQEMNDIYIYILDSGISEINKNKLDSICEKYKRRSIHFIESKDISKVLNMKVAMDRGSMSQYARLFISSVLPENLKRVLYLDCDIIVNDSLIDLWNLDMRGKTIAALKDAFSSWYRMNIDLKPYDTMFNSGVMLVDLTKWKEKNIEEKILEFISKKKGNIQQGDQGALNAVLSHDTYCFEPRFNSVTIYYDFSFEEMLVYRKPPEFYTKQEIETAIEKPVIIHYTTSFLSRRPWVEGCKHRYVDKWMKYKNLSPWKDSPMWKHKERKGLSGLYIRLVHRIPRHLNIVISGLIQAYGRPVLNRLKGY